MRRLALLTLPLALAACTSGEPLMVEQAPPQRTEVQLLAINDFHGRLEASGDFVPVTRADGSTFNVPLGGAAYLSGAIKSLRTDKSITVAAGDLIGATPIASALFLDEPTIEALNLMGLEYSALGNHEFDKGVEELKRIQDGGCMQFTPLTPCGLGKPYEGADFTYLGANVFAPDGTNLFPDAVIHDLGDVQVGIIGLPLSTVPSLVAPNLVDGLRFGDEAGTVNALVPRLLADGADAIVLLIHQGAYSQRWDDETCAGISGPVLDVVERLSDEVDVVVSGHTHNAYTCTLPKGNGGGDRLLTSAGRYGNAVTDIRLSFDGETLVSSQATLVLAQGDPLISRDGKAIIPSNELPRYLPDPEMMELVHRTVTAAGPQAGRIVGSLDGTALDDPDDFESPAANLIADAQLAATRSPDRGNADLAFINGGGVRAAIVPASDGSVSFGALFTVQPFGNTLMTVTLTGAQLKALLEQQFVDADGNDEHYHLIPSGNFAFSYDLTRPAGDRVVAMTLDGEPIDPARDYRVTTNNFVANGGDGYTLFREGRDRTGAGNDVDALVAWIADGREVPAVGRITNLTPAD